MKRIYIDKITHDLIKLNDGNLHYLKKTLRFKGGESILLFDGEHEYIGTYHKDQIKNIKKTREAETPYLKLAIAEIKKERLEWLVEKATEIGVNTITILKTARSQNPIKLERLKKIIISACQQSGRISIPILEHNEFIKFTQIIKQSEWIICSLNTQNTKINQSILGAIIGPEGGFTQEEEQSLSAIPIKFNNNTLRAETAAITALNYIHFTKKNFH